MMSHEANQRVDLGDAFRDTSGKRVYSAFVIGMAIDLVSIYIGNPYIISWIMMPIAVFVTIKWLNQPVPWIVFVSVIAANPVNINASIALNLIFALSLLMLNIRYVRKLPSWLYLTLLLFLISILGSVINWGTTDEYLTQFSAIGNYVVGPFFLIPLIYFRLHGERDADLLLKGFVFSFIVPSATFMLLARLFGSPEIDDNASVIEYLVNVPVYHLGNVNFQLIRTQAGIPLAALICASLAVIISKVSKGIRMIAGVFLLILIFLLLVTGSIGSSLAALCGISAMLIVGFRFISFKRILVVVALLLGFALASWNLVPEGIKQYAESRYEERFSGKGIDASDRNEIWRLSLGYLLDNPEGRGWDLYVEPINTHPHNDYISYGIAFGFVCGFLYLLVPVKFFVSLVGPLVHNKNPAQIAILLAGVGALTVFVINSFSDHLVANRWYFNVVWSMIWYGYYASKSVTSQDSVKQIRVVRPNRVSGTHTAQGINGSGEDPLEAH
jgi:O-antigen ligase